MGREDFCPNVICNIVHVPAYKYLTSKITNVPINNYDDHPTINIKTSWTASLPQMNGDYNIIVHNFERGDSFSHKGLNNTFTTGNLRQFYEYLQVSY